MSISSGAGEPSPGPDAPARRSLFRRPSERTTNLIVLALLLAGGLMRLAWAAHGHLAPTNSEAFFIAQALAEGRGFSEAFGPGTGPTAHLMLLTPLPAALVYSMMGVGTPAAELVLSVWATLCVCGSIYMGQLVMKELGAGPAGRILGVGFAALVPIQPALEVSAFRVWESGLAALVFLSVVYVVLRLDRTGRAGMRELLLVGVSNAVTFLISPAAAIGTSGAIGLWLLRRVRPIYWPAPVLTAIAVVAAVLVPWGLRNEAVLGKFSPLRTGEGISMAMAYHDGRLHTQDIQADDLRRFKDVSPLMGPEARARYLAVGEIAYNRALSAESREWRKAHPQDVWIIRARNYVEFYAPPAWLWTRFTSLPSAPLKSRALVVAGISLIAFATLAVALARRRWRWLYIAAALLLPALPYVVTYPLLRYRYLVSTLLILVACQGVVMLAELILSRGRRQTGA